MVRRYANFGKAAMAKSSARKRIEKILEIAGKHTGNIAQEITAQSSNALVDLDSVERDAARYQWLRKQEWFQTEIDDRFAATTNLEAQDSVIDAAMQSSNQH